MSDAMTMKQLTIQDATNVTTQIADGIKSLVEMEHVDRALVVKNQIQMTPRTEDVDHCPASITKDVRMVEIKMVNADQTLADMDMKT